MARKSSTTAAQRAGFLAGRKPGESITDLAARHGLNRETMRRALIKAERETPVASQVVGGRQLRVVAMPQPLDMARDSFAALSAIRDAEGQEPRLRAYCADRILHHIVKGQELLAKSGKDKVDLAFLTDAELNEYVELEQRRQQLEAMCRQRQAERGV